MDSRLVYKKIKSIKRLKKKQKVYNFNVPGYENYVANGFVVHNCENHSISQVENPQNVKVLTVDQLIKTAFDKHCKSISMSYNEPILSYEYLLELAEKCHENNLKFILKTNAFINKDPWKEICKVVDAMNIDLKAGTKKSFQSITGCSQYITKDRIKEAYDYGVHIEISIPLYYSDNVLDNEIKEIGKFLSSIDKDIPCHLLRISPSYRYDNFIFNPDCMDKAKNILSKYMDNIYEVI